MLKNSLFFSTFCVAAEARAGHDRLPALNSARTPKCKHCLGNILSIASSESHQPSGRQWFSGTLCPESLNPLCPSILNHSIPNPSVPGEGFTPSLPLPVDPGRADLGSRGSPLAPQSPSRSDPKIHQFFDRFLNPFWCHFGSQN